VEGSGSGVGMIGEFTAGGELLTTGSFTSVVLGSELLSTGASDLQPLLKTDSVNVSTIKVVILISASLQSA
jgi:hypothetical protein